MWNEPTKEKLERIPRLYTNEKTSLADVLIYEHFFIFNSDWYMAEYSPEEDLFWGFAILGNDHQNAEWGYISYEELREINIKGFEVDRELNWRGRRASEIEKIVKAHGIY